MTLGIVKISANQPPERFYRGGEKIAAFRSRGEIIDVAADQFRTPEDWVASTTALFGEATLGLSTLPDGTLLRDAVEADPELWLGPEHVRRYGTDMALLVKLLDAGERLPVHFHPDQEFSSTHLGLAHGKTESWIALAPAEVALAFNRDVSEAEIARWVEDQDSEAMLASMHRLQLDAGDAVLVPAGLPHAIGRGAFVVELQEPTDLSILAEWADYAIDGTSDGHLGLGFDLALTALDRRGWTEDEVSHLKGATASTHGPLLPAAKAFFRADRLVEGDIFPAGLAVLVVTRGSGTLRPAAGQETPARAGETLLVPFNAGGVELLGDLEVIACRPPLP